MRKITDMALNGSGEEGTNSTYAGIFGLVRMRAPLRNAGVADLSSDVT
jgi:hypothetical protein